MNEETSDLLHEFEDFFKDEEVDVAPIKKPKKPIPDISKSDIQKEDKEVQAAQPKSQVLEAPSPVPLVEEQEEVQKQEISQELPGFEQEIEEDIDVPLPPPELREKEEEPAHIRLQDIEDEYLGFLEKQADTSKIREELETEEQLYAPVFVNVEDYGKLLEYIKGARTNFRSFTQTHKRLDNMNESHTSTMVKLNRLFEDIQRKLIMMDNALFEKEEE